MQPRSRYLYFLACLGMLLLAAGPLMGAKAQVKKASTVELTRQAEIVAVGKVAEIQSEWNATQTMIRTRVSISVDDFIKGNDPGGTITVYVLGGEIGSVGELYSHMPKFSSKEEVVVFAAKNNEGRYAVSGGPEGKFSVTRDAATGKRMVTETMSLEQLTNDVRAASLELKGN